MHSIVLLTRTLVFCFFVCSLAVGAAWSTPEQVSYQGRLTNTSDEPVTGSYDLTFSIYDVASGGTPLWSELHTAVTVNGGLFTVELGSDSPFSDTLFDGSQRYLAITVADDAEMTPRQPIMSVPYSERVGSLEGAQGGGVSGRVGINVPIYDSIDADLAVHGGSVLDETGGGYLALHHSYWPSNLRFDDNDIQVYNDNAFSQLHLQRFGGGLDIDDGTMQIYGGKVGINFDDPDAPLHLDGGSDITNSGGGQFIIGDGNPNDLRMDLNEIQAFSSGAAENSSLFIQNSGGSVNLASGALSVDQDERIAMGTSNPLAQVHIEGEDVGVGTDHLQQESVVIEDRNAILGLYSDTSGIASSGITFGDVFPYSPSLDNKWSIIRETTQIGGSLGGLRFAWGFDKNPFNNNVRMYISNSGEVGIGTIDPNYDLDVRGTIGNNSTQYHSDRRWKKNVSAYHNALEQVSRLRGVTFEWRRDEFEGMNFPEGNKIGLIAQEVEEVIPELVHTNKDGYKSVEYANLVAVLIEAVKELNKDNQEQRKMNRAQESQIDKLEVRVRELTEKLATKGSEPYGIR
jgi:hypothetical protein